MTFKSKLSLLSHQEHRWDDRNRLLAFPKIFGNHKGQGDSEVFPTAGAKFLRAENLGRDKNFNFSENNFWTKPYQNSKIRSSA